MAVIHSHRTRLTERQKWIDAEKKNKRGKTHIIRWNGRNIAEEETMYAEVAQSRLCERYDSYE